MGAFCFYLNASSSRLSAANTPLEQVLENAS